MELGSSDEPQADFIDVPVENQKPFQKMKFTNNSQANSDNIDTLLDNSHVNTKKKQCLIPFYIWQEQEEDLFASTFETIKEIKTKFEEEVLDNNAKKECESDEFGIFVNENCYYYQVLKSLCLQVKI